MKLLIIPDSHAHPDYDNDRYEHLGELILEERPDAIVELGDFADMPSLSSYDKGRRSFEGRRYKRDVEACRDALSRLHGPVDKYNAQRGRHKKAQYKPTLYRCVGNHEDRIDRVTQMHPELYGTISTEDLGFEERGWNVTPFRQTLEVAGFSICHWFASGVAGRPIGGEHVASSLLRKLHTSCIVGHGHTYDKSERTRPSGAKIIGLSGGCYTHPDMVEGWNIDTARLWWRGVVMLDGAADGYYRELRAITQERVEELYR